MSTAKLAGARDHVSESSDTVLFMTTDPSVPVSTAAGDLPAQYKWELWRPRLTQIVPRGLPLFPFGVWWLFHAARAFANRDYSILLVRDGSGAIVHRSIVTPRYLRFPFMAAQDLQVGDVWTSAEHRRKGLALFALRRLIELFAHDRTIWYVVEASNVASIAAARKAGMSERGRGRRHNRFGLRVLGYYALDAKQGRDAVSQPVI